MASAVFEDFFALILTALLKMGNKAKSNTAANIRSDTFSLDSSLEASKTAANIAALMEMESGNIVCALG